MIKKLYSNGKERAFSVTYDDGVFQDIRFVSLLDKYGLKGTFNLNSALMEKEFEWTHDKIKTVKRISVSRAVTLYKHHEIASHTCSHPYMKDLSEKEILSELSEDKKKLEKYFGKKVRGFAVPFDYYDDIIEDCVRKCGFEYARISEESMTYLPDKNYYRWRASIFHLEPCLDDFTDGFLKTDTELALCQIVGHSYDLDAENLWEKIEEIFRKVSEDPSVCPMTTVELIRYLKAMDSVTITEKEIVNRSDVPLWFEVNGKKVCVIAERYQYN